MKKLILTFILIVNNLFATDYTINCATTLTYTSGSPLLMDWYYMTDFYDEDVMYTANLQDTPQAVFDNTSPACGGSGEQNIIVEITCNDDCTDGFRTNTPSAFSAVEPADGGGYVNTVTIVNGRPCFDTQNTTLPVRFSHTFWDDDDAGKRLSSDYRYGSVKITVFSSSQYGDTLTSDEAKQLREVCTPPDPNAPIDYTGLLKEIIVNTAPNHTTSDKLTNIDNRQNTADSIMDTATQGKTATSILDVEVDKTSFASTFENTLTDSYTQYADIFGFGGYGTAPAPISFNMFGKDYVVFDIASIGADNIDLIRNTFLIFAYLFGFIIVFRGN